MPVLAASMHVLVCVYDLVMYVRLCRRCLLPCGFLPLLGLAMFVALSPARKLKHLQCWFDGLAASMIPLSSESRQFVHGVAHTMQGTAPPRRGLRLAYEHSMLGLRVEVSQSDRYQVCRRQSTSTT